MSTTIINVHFIGQEGKKMVKQLKSDFTYKDFVHMIDDIYGPNSHRMLTLVVKNKELNMEDEREFEKQKKLITNSVNIFVGRRMHGGHY